MTAEALKRELDNLHRQYLHELECLQRRAAEAHGRFGFASTHDAFNMSATCQNLAVLAGKIEQTANVLRWMEAK